MGQGHSLPIARLSSPALSRSDSVTFPSHQRQMVIKKLQHCLECVLPAAGDGNCFVLCCCNPEQIVNTETIQKGWGGARIWQEPAHPNLLPLKLQPLSCHPVCLGHVLAPELQNNKYSKSVILQAPDALFWGGHWRLALGTCTAPAAAPLSAAIANTG